MADNVVKSFSNKITNVDNLLERELVEARHKMRERLQIEGKKSLYKNRSNRWTLIGAFSLWLGYKLFNAVRLTKLHPTLEDD